MLYVSGVPANVTLNPTFAILRALEHQCKAVGIAPASVSARERALSSTATIAAVQAGDSRRECATIHRARDSVLAPRVSRRRTRWVPVAASAPLTKSIARSNCRTNARCNSWPAHSGRPSPGRSSQTNPAIVPTGQRMRVALVVLLVTEIVDVAEAPGALDVVLVDVAVIVVELVAVVVVFVVVAWVPVVEEIVVLLVIGVDVLDVVVVGT